MKMVKGEEERVAVYKDEKARVAPYMGVGVSYLQATSDQEDEEATEEERHKLEEERQRKEVQHSEEKEDTPKFVRERRSEPSPNMKWADCVEEPEERGDEKKQEEQFEKREALGDAEWEEQDLKKNKKMNAECKITHR